jgi:GTP-binding protein
VAKIVALVGRPNVGKSTLFNRLTESRAAIVNEESGTTRDRQYGKVEWAGTEFSLIDTGGWVEDSGDVFESEINKQVSLAIEEADVIVMVVDVMTGITDLDSRIAGQLRRSGKPVVVAVNKTDTFDKSIYVHEFHALGLGVPLSVSALNGTFSGDLLDGITAKIPENNGIIEQAGQDIPKIAIVGRPNVGKSTLLNTLLGEERSIVTDMAGTTRDVVRTPYNKYGFNLELVDTAGIRRKGKVTEGTERFSVMRSIRAIEDSDVCILMGEGMQTLMDQDLKILSLIQKNRKGIVICMNKWDLIENPNDELQRSYLAANKSRLGSDPDIPIVFISALHKVRIHRVLEESVKVYENMHRVIPTSQLNECLRPVIEQTPPPQVRGHEVKIKYITQLRGTNIPSFVFFCNNEKAIKENYLRFLERQIRKHWKFTGTPINLFIRKNE